MYVFISSKCIEDWLSQNMPGEFSIKQTVSWFCCYKGKLESLCSNPDTSLLNGNMTKITVKGNYDFTRK